jgi:hypothetical protein
MYIQHEYEFITKHKGLDWTTPGFGRGFGMYIMLQTIGNMVQNYLYFLVGTMGDGTSELSRGIGLLRGVESWRQCASFGTGSSKFSPFYTTVINMVFWAVSLVPAFITIWEVQDRKIVEKGVSGESETDGQISEKAVVV